MDNNFHESIDLDNISEEAYFSKFHFIRLFKKIYEKTPRQYLMQVRIENAKKYLEEGFKVTETCYKVGFDSLTSFAGLFKKVNGKTASEYQRLYKYRQERIKNKPLTFIPNCFAQQNGWTENSNFQEMF
jgi:AraC-like DNA-binding protein